MSPCPVDQVSEVVYKDPNAFAMMTGIIARKKDNGFGFIKPDVDGEKDVFFHARALVDGLMFDDLREGDRVSYEVEQGPKGPAAINVARA